MIKAGIIGGSGYTGAELLRLLAQHPEVEIAAVASRRLSGQPLENAFSNFSGRTDLHFVAPDDAALLACDVVFFATPHGVSMNNVNAFLAKNIKVVDLGADFRIKDPDVWKHWYGDSHSEKKWLKKAVYGLSEIRRDEIQKAALIANPGCYSTAVLLGLFPLLKHRLIRPETIIADCKSGVSGAGRGANQATLFSEAGDSIKAYGISGHRHLPEIIQELEAVAKTAVGLTFIPHLTPMIRGILATIYVDLIDDADPRDFFEQAYGSEYFVKILKPGVLPQTRSVRASNFCHLNVERVADGKAVVVVAIDNLVKGASGQAIQNMNIIFGMDEKSGLESIGVAP